jgi:hypothetical protein
VGVTAALVMVASNRKPLPGAGSAGEGGRQDAPPSRSGTPGEAEGSGGVFPPPEIAGQSYAGA